MKYSNLIKNSLLVAMAALAAAACREEVNIGNLEAPEINGEASQLLYVLDANGSIDNSSLEFRNKGSLDLFVNAIEKHSADQSVTFTYDPTVLAAYNKANNTEFEAVPESLVTLSNGGVATLAAGSMQSAAVTLSLTSNGSLAYERTYVIPLRIESKSSLAQKSQSRIIFVKDLSGLADCAKTWIDNSGNVHEGIKIFSCMEINDTNPLNNLRYTLKKSGKYMIDALIMFSGNINYNAETGRVYFYANPNIQYCLDNRETLLKPLQDRGMKVLMGVMCNHDRACISNLAPETAKLFAQELKALCDAYDLDGIFWDDEYCSPISPAPAGFVDRSKEAFSRLCYEVWKLQPERWNVAYGYSMTFSAQEIDGVQPGMFINYCLPDYSNYYSDYTGNYPGMKLNQMGGCSMEFAQSRWGATENTLRGMRNAGYGAHMVFAMDPTRGNEWGQDQAMGKLARSFYDDEVVVDPTKYAKTW